MKGKSATHFSVIKSSLKQLKKRKKFYCKIGKSFCAVLEAELSKKKHLFQAKIL